MNDHARYHRQMLLSDFGEDGQQRLSAARVLLVGCGALGTVIADALVRAGVGCLVLVDRDFVELTNLQRQVLFDESDAAEALPKAEAARRKLTAINGEMELVSHATDFNSRNAERIASDVDIILDGTDNFETRFLLNDVAVKCGLPFVYGGAVATHGTQLTVLPRSEGGDTPWERMHQATPCLRCLFDDAPPAGSGPTCDTAGVLASVAGLVAHYQVVDAMKILLGRYELVAPQLRSFDPWYGNDRSIDIADAVNPECPCCSHRRFEYLEGSRQSSVANLCGRDAVQILPSDHTGAQQLEFEAIAGRLAPYASVQFNRFTLRADLHHNDHSYQLTLFSDGRAIIKGADDPAIARNLYARYIGL